MKTNKKTIKIISIKDHGKNHNWFCENVLMLRTAKHPNDVEIINHTVLGNLRRFPSDITFEILN